MLDFILAHDSKTLWNDEVRLGRIPGYLPVVGRIIPLMFLGNRRTTRPIRAYRSPGEAVFIPKDSVLRDVRTSTEPGYPVPIAMAIVARQNPSLHVFEFRGETLYMHFSQGLMKATMEAVEE